MKNFMMSFRFNKQSPPDFGLSYKNGHFFSNKDGTEWIPCRMYDFGWGEEIGFYKAPLGSFEELLRLVLRDDDLEDSYGAAAAIQNMYPMQLKEYLMNLVCQKKRFRDRKKLRKLKHFFKLHKGLVGTCRTHTSIVEVEKEHNDWKRITEFFSDK